VYPVQALTLADQIGSATLSWHAYMEDMADPQFGPGPCVHPGPDEREEPELGGYTVKHNPFAYFHSLLDLGDCATNDVPLADLRKDLRSEATTADFSFISPNLCNSGRTGECADGRPEGPAAADAFLEKWVPVIEESPAFEKDGLLIITFGETEAPVSPAEPEGEEEGEPLRVGALLYSRYVSAGSTNGTVYGPFSMLRSVEDLLGLDHLVAAGSEEIRSFAGQFLALGVDG
jgi:hypothetical protein